MKRLPGDSTPMYDARKGVNHDTDFGASFGLYMRWDEKVVDFRGDDPLEVYIIFLRFV